MKCTQRPRHTLIKSGDFWQKASDWKQVLCSHSPSEKQLDFMSDLPISVSLAAFSFVLPPSSPIFLSLSQGAILTCGYGVSGPEWQSQWWCRCFWEEHTLRAQALSLCGVSRALGRLQAWLQTNPRVWFWGLGDLLSSCCQLRGTQSCQHWGTNSPLPHCPALTKTLICCSQAQSFLCPCEHHCANNASVVTASEVFAWEHRSRGEGQEWEKLYFPLFSPWPGFLWWENDFPLVLGTQGQCLHDSWKMLQEWGKMKDGTSDIVIIKLLFIQGLYWLTSLFFNS